MRIVLSPKERKNHENRDSLKLITADVKEENGHDYIETMKP